MEFRTSEKTELLDAALVKVQATIKKAEKSKTNPHFKSKFADLVEVWAACKEQLTANGISVTQWPVAGAVGTVSLLTRVGHTSGQWMAAGFSIPASKNDAQGFGSALTYAKRYSLAAIVGVVSDDEDDDGNDSTAQTQQGQQKPPAQSGPWVPSEPQLKRLYTILDAAQRQNRWPADTQVKDFMSKLYGIKSTKELNRQQYDQFCTLLQGSSYEACLADWQNSQADRP